MKWYWIVSLSIIGVHLFNAIVVIIADTLRKDSGVCIPYMAFTIWIPIIIFVYPIRTVLHYNFFSVYYRNHGISRLAYLFGKRVKEEEEED